MRKPFFKFQYINQALRRQSLTRILGLTTGVVCSILLPFCLMDEAHPEFYQNRSGNSVFTNAVLFYTGHQDRKQQVVLPKPDRYIAIVTYIGMPENSDAEDIRSTVDEIIRDRVAPAFETKGLRFDHKTNEITNVRLYYNKKGNEGRDEPDVKVFCFVTSRAAFAVVVV